MNKNKMNIMILNDAQLSDDQVVAIEAVIGIYYNIVKAIDSPSDKQKPFVNAIEDLNFLLGLIDKPGNSNQ